MGASLKILFGIWVGEIALMDPPISPLNFTDYVVSSLLKERVAMKFTSSFKTETSETRTVTLSADGQRCPWQNALTEKRRLQF